MAMSFADEVILTFNKKREYWVTQCSDKKTILNFLPLVLSGGHFSWILFIAGMPQVNSSLICLSPSIFELRYYCSKNIDVDICDAHHSLIQSLDDDHTVRHVISIKVLSLEKKIPIMIW